MLTMRLFWWQQLPLLIFIQLLEPSRSSYKLYAEALLAFKSTVVSHRQFNSRVAKHACLRQFACVNHYDLKDQEPSIELHAITYQTRKTRISATVDGSNSVPTLTPVQVAQEKKPGKQKVAAIVGGAGAAFLVVIIIVFVYICLMRVKRSLRQTSETASSIPSPPCEGGTGKPSPYIGGQSRYDTHSLRRLTIWELAHATGNFSESNIIGEGGFGLVYKGLLQDGTIVAIKRRLSVSTPYFVVEVERIVRVHHKHLVKLIGYCEGNNQQFVVSEYIPNGNVGNHLYDGEGMPLGKLDMQQRLVIALGAARGLEHLHGLEPPKLHRHFRTSNVLVDENYAAKVSDFELGKLLVESSRPGSSSAIDCFLDPGLRSLKDYSERSDVYSFGVFLLELLSGQEIHSRIQQNSLLNVVSEAKEIQNLQKLDNFVDKILGDHAMDAAKQILDLAVLCTDISARRRPTMKNVAEDLQRIQEIELGHLHHELGEEIGVVTLGSELFK